MGKLRSASVAFPFVCIAGLAGCDKGVDLTFVNLTGDSLDVHVTSPGQGREYIGVIAPMGQLRHELEIDKKDLPARCSWSAGPCTDQFTITKDTPGKLWIDIRPMGQPRLRDEQTPPNEEIQIKPTPIRIQGEAIPD